MTRYVALLRGINVGGHRVKMDRLREIFEELPVSDVSTFIASGNVLFSADSDEAAELEATIGAHLADRLGYEVPTFLRTPRDLEDVLRFDLPEGALSDGNAVYVSFLADPVTESMVTAFAELESDTDRFAFAEREIYWCVKGKLSDSPLFKSGIDGALGGAATTMRNLNTVRRLVAKF